jgi:histidinol-phosphate aminotransferase
MNQKKEKMKSLNESNRSLVMQPREINFSVEHGGREFESNAIDFSISINPYQPNWIDYVFNRARSLANKYIYLDNVEEELESLVNEEVTITAGATEALYLIPMLFPSKKALIPFPTYSEYERVSRIFGLEVIKLPLSPTKIAEHVDKNSIVFFCNPNNPDGRYFPPKKLKPIIDAVSDTNSVLVLDEVFKDFVKDYKSPEGENIIKLRSFTKSYGLPGIRIGYMTNRMFRKVRMPWNIGALGYAFLERLIEDEFRFLDETIPKIWIEREKFEKIGLKSDANFFLLKRKGIYERLRRRGLIVRDCRSFGLKDHIRFSIRKPEENNMLITALKEELD